MRDPDLMIQILAYMAEQPSGRLRVASLAFGLGGAIANEILDEAERHHVDLLLDSGYVQWHDEHHTVVRITNDGYDFLNAIQQDTTLKEKFMTYFNRGVSFADAATKIVALARAAIG